jgi:phosphatidylglycerol---prolipoprotein diacylglyceryl transferase
VMITMYYKNAVKIPGLMFSVFLIILWTFRFFIEFVKENQVASEATMKLNIGQQLSIPFALIGVGLLIGVLIRYKKKQAEKKPTT